VILSSEYLQRTLDDALTQVSVPDGCAAVLEGSIAAGFGNETSDIDLLLIEDGDRQHITMPTILFIDGRRVEVRLRSAGQLRRQAEELVAYIGRRGRGAATIPEDLLDRCQRLSCAFPLRRPELVADLQADVGDLAPVVSAWFGHRAGQAALRAIAMEALGCQERAVHWARSALRNGAKSWAASQGETYLDGKWLSQQLDRLKDPSGLVREFWAVTSAEDLPLSRQLQLSLDLLTRFGITAATTELAHIHLIGAPGVTTWQIGDRIHVLRGRADVFVLGRRAGDAWRSVVFEVPLPELLASTFHVIADFGEFIARFEQLGLVRLARRPGGVIEAPAAITPIAATRTPAISLHGALLQDAADDDQVELVSLSADRFVAAGMSLIWANVMVENAKEDLVGAIKRGQFRTADAAARRMFAQACRSLLSAFGFSPPAAPEDAPQVIATLPAVPADIRREAASLAQIAPPSDGRAADRLLSRLDDFVKRTRDVSDLILFPPSFVSAQGWQQTLEHGYDWIRLGAYLEADFPIEEARDLITSGGLQPVLRARLQSTHQPQQRKDEVS
jgi:hypothetical protein